MEELLPYITARLELLDEIDRDNVEEALAMAVNDAEDAYIL